ncbi:spermidine/spermine N(1)-acetyltransferase-like protein 1 [Dipodomys merriami]|uniref:spermidine/spermine N(1)-acetyltransferase-like protein 1 n=1 Tax=Dipodomys merriami TaxID=94247 RepID=UPI0038560639
MNQLGKNESEVNKPTQTGREQTDTNQPGTNLPDSCLFDMNQPERHRLSISLHDMKKLDMKYLDMLQSEVGQKSLSHPSLWQPGMSNPISGQPGTSHLERSQANKWCPVEVPSCKNCQDTSELSKSQEALRSPVVIRSIMTKLDMSQLTIDRLSVSSQSDASQSGPSQSSKNNLNLNPPSSSQSNATEQGKPRQSSKNYLNLNPPSTSQSNASEQGRSQSPKTQQSTTSFQIRPAEPEDCGEILRLIKELAASDDTQHTVKITAGDLLRDGFGVNPLFYCLVAEVFQQQKKSAKEIVGFAMYYFTYDLWIGKVLYLEDFYVIHGYQDLGIGTEMLRKISQIAIRSQCGYMHFLVVLSNQDSVDYYTHRGAVDLSFAEGWHLFRFTREDLQAIAGEE